MRIANHKVTVRSIIFSKPSGAIYFLISAFFVYKSFLLLPVWASTHAKAEESRLFYEKKQQQVREINEELENKQTNLGKERYQKDFFNKLDEGEHLIILHQENKVENVVNEQERKMFWWEEIEQNFLVWWRNL